MPHHCISMVGNMKLEKVQLEIEYFGKEKSKKRVHLCINHTTVLWFVIIKHLHEPDKWWHCNFDSEGTGFKLRPGNQSFQFRCKLFSLSFLPKKPSKKPQLISFVLLTIPHHYHIHFELHKLCNLSVNRSHTHTQLR